MSALYADSTSARASDSFSRAAGFAGLAFATLVITHNVLRGQPFPHASAAADIVAHYQDQRGIIVFSHMLFLLALPALLVYAVGLMRRYSPVPAAEPWSRVGRTSAYLVAVSFGTLMATDMAATMLASMQPADPSAVHAVFALRGGIFIVNTALLAVTLGTFAWAARLSGAEPAWLSGLGLLGALLLYAGALPAVLALEGSPIGMLGLGGFILWLVWVLTTAVRMLRSA